MRKLEGIVKEIVDEMDYLKKREERFQDTNGKSVSFLQHVPFTNRLVPFLVSTNVRVQNFAWFTIVALLSLGVWQIMHLRAFFKRKYLID
jgi:p24 family protein delta-1